MRIYNETEAPIECRTTMECYQRGRSKSNWHHKTRNEFEMIPPGGSTFFQLPNLDNTLMNDVVEFTVLGRIQKPGGSPKFVEVIRAVANVSFPSSIFVRPWDSRDCTEHRAFQGDVKPTYKVCLHP